MATDKPNDPRAAQQTFRVKGIDEKGRKFRFHVTDPVPNIGDTATGRDIRTGKLVTITITGRNTPTGGGRKTGDTPGSTG